LFAAPRSFAICALAVVTLVVSKYVKKSASCIPKNTMSNCPRGKREVWSTIIGGQFKKARPSVKYLAINGSLIYSAESSAAAASKMVREIWVTSARPKSAVQMIDLAGRAVRAGIGGGSCGGHEMILF
jgi:hypothetical protein